MSSFRTLLPSGARRSSKHRRWKGEDVLDFKAKRDKDMRAGLRELSPLTRDFGGYDAEVK